MAMIEAATTVIKVEGQTVWVAGGESSACGSCGQKSGCASAAFENVFGKKTVQADSHFRLQAGDKVLIEIDESTLLRGAVLMYLLPLLGMFAAVVVADSFILPKDLPMRDLWLSGSALLGLLSSFIKVGRYKHGTVRPMVVRKLL